MLPFSQMVLVLTDFMFSGRMPGPPESSVLDVVSVDWLEKHKNSVVLLDATYENAPKRDYKEFKEKHYGKFEKLMAAKTNFTETFAAEHIPGAVLFNMDAAYYPSQYIRSDLYPPHEFEKYIRLLGVNAGDHIVIYARGQFAGMFFAARAWWTFKVYGHHKVSVLNGGLDAWKKANNPVTSTMVAVKPGNWVAKPLDESLLITFEELDKVNADGKSLFQDLSKVNYLDSRPAEVFNGSKPLGIPAEGATGSRLKGSKNVPLSDVFSDTGIRSREEIEQALKKAGYNSSLPIIAACNGGVQASLLALALSYVGKQYRLYNGSLMEIGARAPHMISEK
ncbi:hypothetical protein Y032_0039g52 [Ancylostoma ceylanicum]|uniref:Rhodanese domain-containing protein n=2 Tax=Ancylostoma ceylanicum TaxID=53326 RepID=A0A016UI49_9BILA|nr:hypothetical protein Y032_0039g52 [Ancylostoma ceylanicum]